MRSLTSSSNSRGTPRRKANSEDEWEYAPDRLTIEVIEQEEDDPPVILDQYGEPYPPTYRKPAMGFDLTQRTKRRRK
jgi:hypothetical protein